MSDEFDDIPDHKIHVDEYDTKQYSNSVKQSIIIKHHRYLVPPQDINDIELDKLSKSSCIFHLYIS